jgi:cell division protein FtsL
MNQIENITQAYSQAPWRKQLQFIGLFSLFLVFIALVAGIYLNVSARTAKVGRDIQYMKKQIETLDREIEDKQSQLAYLLSDREMGKRAQRLGYEPLGMNEAKFLPVPGHIGRKPAILAPYLHNDLIGAPIIPKEYIEPLFDWLKKQSGWISFTLPEVTP